MDNDKACRSQPRMPGDLLQLEQMILFDAVVVDVLVGKPEYDFMDVSPIAAAPYDKFMRVISLDDGMNCYRIVQLPKRGLALVFTDLYCNIKTGLWLRLLFCYESEYSWQAHT